MKARQGRRCASLVLLLASAWVTRGYAETVTYVYTDPQGTVLAETDEAGNVTAEFDYRPYGSLALGAPPNGPGYTGHVSDADTGLVYMQQRYYDPAIGRFLSVDPVTAYGGDMRQFNRYAHAYNNPYKFTDPDGRCPDACVIEGGIFIGAGVVYVGAAALGAIGICAAACDSIQRGIEGGAEKLRNLVQNSGIDTPASAGQKVRDGTKPAVGDSGANGEREGAGGSKGRDEAWGKIDGKETSPKDGVRVKELSGGGRAETHDSTKSRDYPQGTPTIKIQNEKGKVETTVRYPKDH